MAIIGHKKFMSFPPQSSPGVDLSSLGFEPESHLLLTCPCVPCPVFPLTSQLLPSLSHYHHHLLIPPHHKLDFASFPSSASKNCTVGYDEQKFLYIESDLLWWRRGMSTSFLKSIKFY